MDIIIMAVVALTLLLFAGRVIAGVVKILYDIGPIFVLWSALFFLLYSAGVLNQESDVQDAGYIERIEDTSGSSGYPEDWHDVEVFSPPKPRSKGSQD